MKDEEIDKMADDFVNAQEFTKVYGTARKAECGAFWKYGFLAGLKAGRPQWHDLRKDPNDLPKDYAENTRFLCSVKGETLYLIRYGSFWQGNFEVDAWCEIPTFDKEKKESE